MKLLGHKIAHNIFVSEVHVNRVEMSGKTMRFVLSADSNIFQILRLLPPYTYWLLCHKNYVRATHVNASLRTTLSTISYSLVATSVLPSVDICVWFVLYEPLQSLPHGEHATLILSFCLWLWKEQEWRINLMTLEKCRKFFFLPAAIGASKACLTNVAGVMRRHDLQNWMSFFLGFGSCMSLVGEVWNFKCYFPTSPAGYTQELE